MKDKYQLSSYQVFIMALTAGICVANIYYNQPLLHKMAVTLQQPDNKMGIVSVIAQAGYGLGLFFITPLGDKMNRRKLILLLQIFLSIALLGMALAHSMVAILVSSLFIGLFSVAAQVIIPLGAYLSPKNKGKTVGFIFTGVLIGILAARVLSGFIADWLDWRSVYWIAAIMVFCSALLLYCSLPNVQKLFKGSYFNLLGSTLFQAVRFRLLRSTAFLGAMVFGIFCSFWTNLTFHLSSAPFHFNTDIIGLFGLLAIGGALAAPVFGKLADKGGARRSQLFSITILLISILITLFLPFSIPGIIVTVLLLDIGVQAIQITNLATIYTLDEGAHSRINTVYMTSYFLGGALGSYIGLFCWKLGNWNAVAWQLLIIATVALVYIIFRKNKYMTTHTTNGYP